ncbi:MAG: hypothetical protein ACAH80_07525 [Alphaproteobacteria bacterium]
MEDWMKASMKRSVDGGIKFIEDHPDLTCEFNVRGSAAVFPPMISAKNGAAQQLENAIEGNEGHSGASFFFAFKLFMQEAKERGFYLGEGKEPGTYLIRKNPLPDVKTESDVTPMKQVKLKQKP